MTLTILMWLSVLLNVGCAWYTFSGRDQDRRKRRIVEIALLSINVKLRRNGVPEVPSLTGVEQMLDIIDDALLEVNRVK